MEKIKIQLLIAYIGENVAGGFYLKLADFNQHSPSLADRLRTTAGDEIRHGEYFNQCYEDLYGKKLNTRKGLMQAGKVFSYVSKIVPRDKLFNFISKGEKSAVIALEKEIATQPNNPYIEIAKRILPDERKHAEPYHDWL